MALTDMRTTQRQPVTTRRSRVDDRREEDAEDQDQGPIFEREEPLTVGDEQPDAKDAIAEAQRIADQNARERDTERQRREDAERRLGESTVARIGDRKAMLGTQKQTAESAKATAKAALKAAREAGDIDAEIAAQEAFNTADINLRGALNGLAEVERVEKQGGGRTTEARTDQQQGPSAEAQRWIDTHPRFTKDPEYEADALSSHTLALKAGHADGSRSYVDFIEARMTKLYGAGHGDTSKIGKGRAPASREGRSQRRDSTSTSLPPDRGEGEGRSGGGRVGQGGSVSLQHAQGSLSLSYDSDGTPRLRGVIPSDWREAWKWQKRNFKTEVDYAVEQMKIEADRRAGRATGLTQEDEVYR